MKDEMEQKREEQLEERIVRAQARGNALSGLMLGERIDLGDGNEVMAVPNGWIFIFTHKAGVAACFAPSIPRGKVKTEPSIVIPE